MVGEAGLIAEGDRSGAVIVCTTVGGTGEVIGVKEREVRSLLSLRGFIRKTTEGAMGVNEGE